MLRRGLRAPLALTAWTTAQGPLRGLASLLVRIMNSIRLDVLLCAMRTVKAASETLPMSVSLVKLRIQQTWL